MQNAPAASAEKEDGTIQRGIKAIVTYDGEPRGLEGYVEGTHHQQARYR